MKLGTIIYYLLWPAIWFYAPLRLRVSVVLFNQGEILEVKNWLGPNRWQLPGGGIKIGEKIDSAAKRELQEELGVTVEQFPIRIATTDSAVVFKQYGLLVRTHIAYVRLDSKPTIARNKELTAHRWIKLEDSSVPRAVRSLIEQG